MEKLFNKLAGNMIAPVMAETLAAEFRVQPKVLSRLGLGYHPTKGAFAMPERNGTGKIIGISLRYPDTKKFMEKGSRRGLFYEVNPDYNSDGRMYEPGKHNWVRIQSAGIVCPICGKSDWCLVSAENPEDPAAVMCTRIEKGSER